MSEQGEWFFIVDEAGDRRQTGPVPSEELVEMAYTEEIAGDTLVWREGMAEWLPLCEVPEFSGLYHQDEAPQQAPEPEPGVATEVVPAEAEAGAAEPSDLVTLRDSGNHSVRLSRSRKTLLIVTNDYHAGPLELTKLDLLEFLTAMERADGRGE